MNYGFSGDHTLHKIDHPSTLNILELVRKILAGSIPRKFWAGKLFLGTSDGLFVAEPDDGRYRGHGTSGNLQIISPNPST